jgi:hypothetical protein
LAHSLGGMPTVVVGAHGFAYITGVGSAAGVTGSLHALVIGVSSYPHARDYNLGSAPGPAIAAARFAQWLRTTYRNPTVDVRSVRVLLSPTEEEAVAVAEAVGQVDGRANLAGVTHGLRVWAEDCNANTNDIGLLYLAGHGTSMVVGGGFLLLEDFGEPDAPFSHALDLQYVMDAMSKRKAHANFIFVDACRNTIEAQKDHVFTGIQNITLNKTAAVLRKVLKVCYGAAPDKSAWTSSDDDILQYGTIFLKALLNALNKGAVELDQEGRLCVMANRLTSETARGVRTEARFLSQTYAQEMLGSGDGVGTLEEVPFHWPEVVPVDLEIELDPAIVARFAEASLFRVISSAQASYCRQVSFDPHPSQIRGIDSGKYRLQVGPPIPPTMHDWFVLPSSPRWKVTLPYDSH